MRTSKLLWVSVWPSAIGVTFNATLLAMVVAELTVLLLKISSERPLTLRAKPSKTGLPPVVSVRLAKFAGGVSVIGIDALLPTGVSNSH